MFAITSVCVNDIIQAIEDDNGIDELQKLFWIKKAKKLNENEMKWIAGKLCDNYVENYFWEDLGDRFKQIVKNEELSKRLKK